MPQYQGGFYGGRQAAGDVLRQIFDGLRIGRQDALQARAFRQDEAERAQLQRDRADEMAYRRGRDARQDEIDAEARAQNAGVLAIQRVRDLADLRTRGISEGTAPTNVTESVDLSGIGGIGRSFVQSPTRYRQLTDGFYEDAQKTPDAIAETQKRMIARIAQRVAAGDQTALGEAVAAGVNVSDLDPTRRAGTPQYLAAQRAELELRDQFDARQQARQVAGQLRVARDGRAADAAAGGAAGKPPTEGELSGAGYLSRAIEAHGMLDNIRMPSTLSRFTGDMAVIGQTDAFREWNAVRKNWATAVLRKESGASISPAEYESVDAMYIPLPGDSPAQLELKRKNRQAELRTLQIMSGRAAPMAYEGRPADGATAGPVNPHR